MAKKTLLDTDLIKITVILEDSLEDLLFNPDRVFHEVQDMGKMLAKARTRLYEMLAMHFNLRRNEDGTSWKPNTEFTRLLKAAAIAKFSDPFKPAMYDEPMKASGDYYRDLTTEDANPLHMIEDTARGGKVQIGTTLPQAINEEEHYISNDSAIIPSAVNNPVPAREVMWFDNEAVDDLIELLDEHIEEVLFGDTIHG